MISDEPRDYQISRLSNYPILAGLLFFAAVTASLAAGLRPDAFFVGDPGVKLIVARNAIAHPLHPLNIPLPIVGDQSLPYVEPFFAVHGDHSHAVTTELFPLISAPLIALLGMRGAYLLPALGFLSLLAACAWLASALDARRRPLVVATTAALGTPFLFYGLEFWEHAPALALAAVATTLFVKAIGGSQTRRLALGSGLVFGLAVMLRPETAWAVAAVLAATPFLEGGRRGSSAAQLALGVLVAMAPLEIYALVHFGSFLPSHVAANSGLLAANWAAERFQLAKSWFVPAGWTFSGPTNASSFWSVAPAALVAIVPLQRGVERRGRRFLWTVAGVTALLVLLSAPNDGGGQWGPRYLLFAYVPLVVLASDAIENFSRRSTVALIAVVVVAIGGIWIQRSAYRQLRGAKVTYGQVVDFVADEVAPGGYLVTDLWWLDQIAAAATTERKFVYVPDATTGHAVMQRLSKQIIPIVTVIRSRSESPDVSAWAESTCYVEIRRHTLPVRDLVAIWLHHRCSQ